MTKEVIGTYANTGKYVSIVPIMSFNKFVQERALTVQCVFASFNKINRSYYLLLAIPYQHYLAELYNWEAIDQLKRGPIQQDVAKVSFLESESIFR